MTKGENQANGGDVSQYGKKMFLKKAITNYWDFKELPEA
jgi:hypothetical protein